MDETGVISRSEITSYSDSFDDAFKDRQVTPEKRERLTKYINETVSELGEVLNVPALPLGAVAVEAYKAVNENPPKAQAILYRNKDASIYSAIQFHPDNLVSWAESFNDLLIGDLVKADIRATIAHEMYHVSQAYRFPNTFFASNPRDTDKSHTTYLRNRVEYAARLFELKYITSYKTENWRESLGHFVVGMSSRISVLESSSARKN